MIRGECKMCGMCCRLDIITVPESGWSESLEELSVLKGKQYIDTRAGIRRYASWAPCSHLDLITNKCEIQGHKPQYCKDYPTNEADVLPGCGYTNGGE